MKQIKQTEDSYYVGATLAFTPFAIYEYSYSYNSFNSL